MSNARARAWQLHREALRPKRVTDRVVGEPVLIPAYGKEWPASASVNQDIACDMCGHHLCSCLKHAPKTIAKPALQSDESRLPAGLEIPKGWRPGSVDDCDAAHLYMRGNGDVRVCVCVAGGWNAFRPDHTNDNFANVYAACLFALGCEVEDLGSCAYRWAVNAMARRDDELPAIVERLTAERVKAAKPSEPAAEASGLAGAEQ